jgi:hypothetical protein
MTIHPSRSYLAAIGSLLVLAGCGKKSLIVSAPGSTDPQALMIGTMEQGVDVSKWTASFSHREKGAWIPDTVIPMADRPVLILDRFTKRSFFPKAGTSSDSLRIQVLSGAELLDEAILSGE